MPAMVEVLPLFKAGGGVEPQKREKRGAIPRWADAYGYSERQIKNWLKHGRERGDVPPLDSPAEMVAWFERIYRKKVPFALTQAVAKLTGEAPKGGAIDRPPDPPKELPQVSDEDLTQGARLDRQKRKHAVLDKLHLDALTRGDFPSAARFEEQARKLSAEIRQLEDAVRDDAVRAGELVRKVDVVREVTEGLLVLKRSLFGAGPKAAGPMRHAQSDAEAVGVFKKAIEDVFASCVDSNWAEPLALR